jgi:hypothetical protein
VRLFDEVFEEAIRGEVADLEVKRREVNGPDVRGGEVKDLEAMDNLTIQEINSSGWLHQCCGSMTFWYGSRFVDPYL